MPGIAVAHSPKSTGGAQSLVRDDRSHAVSHYDTVNLLRHPICPFHSSNI